MPFPYEKVLNNFSLFTSLRMGVHNLLVRLKEIMGEIAEDEAAFKKGPEYRKNRELLRQGKLIPVEDAIDLLAGNYPVKIIKDYLSTSTVKFNGELYVKKDHLETLL